VFGDAAQRVILAAAQANHAALVILAIPENDRARQAVRRIRAFNPTVQILARVHDLAWRARLLEAGAAEVIQPEEEAASTLIRHALERLSLPRRARAAISTAIAARWSASRPRRQKRAAAARESASGRPPDGQSLGEARMRERSGSPSSRDSRDR
jgi:voltage-gated potassium channel Kch